MADAAALQNVIAKIVKEKSFALGLAWAPHGDTLTCAGTPFFGADPKVNGFKHKSEEFKLGKGKGLPGRVWANKKAEFKDDVQTFTVEQYPRLAVAKESGLKGCYGFPVLKHGEVAYVVEFFSFSPVTEDAALEKHIEEVLVC